MSTNRGVTYSDPALAGGFGIIYRNFMRCPNITMQAKSVYCYLVSFAGSTGKAFPSQSTMCQELGITKPTLRKYITELVSAGAITVQTDPENPFHRSHRYFIQSGFSLEVKKNFPQGENNFHLEGKKLTPNNNLNNNQNNNQGADGQSDRPAAQKPDTKPKTFSQQVWSYWDLHYPDTHNGESALHQYPAEAKALKKLEGQPWPEIRVSIDRFFAITPKQDRHLAHNQRVLIFVQNYQNRLLQKARADYRSGSTVNTAEDLSAALAHDEQLRQQQLAELRQKGIAI